MGRVIRCLRPSECTFLAIWSFFHSRNKISNQDFIRYQNERYDSYWLWYTPDDISIVVLIANSTQIHRSYHLLQNPLYRILPERNWKKYEDIWSNCVVLSGSRVESYSLLERLCFCWHSQSITHVSPSDQKHQALSIILEFFRCKFIHKKNTIIIIFCFADVKRERKQTISESNWNLIIA